MNKSNKFVESLKISDIKNCLHLLMSLVKNYQNYLKIKTIINDSFFLEYELKECFFIIKHFYEKQNAKQITKYMIDTYCVENNVSEATKNRLDMIMRLSEKQEEDFDIVLNNFTKTSGTLKLMSEVEGNGGFDNYVSKLYQKSSTNNDMLLDIKTLCDSNLKIISQGLNVEDLSTTMSDYITNDLFSAKKMGVKILGMPLLSKLLQGYRTGINGFGSFSGFGKSTLGLALYVISALEYSEDEKVLLIMNEQESAIIKELLLMAFIQKIKHNKGKISRNYFNEKGYEKLTEEQRLFIIEAGIEFEERYRNRIKYVFLPGFNSEQIELLVSDHVRQGYKHFMVDTLKPDMNTNDQQWMAMEKLSVKLDEIGKTYKVSMFVTFQLAQGTMFKKYLTPENIGKAKSITEVMENVVLFRPLKKEEIPNITCSYYDSKGEWSDGIQLETHNENGSTIEYLAMFILKNRNGKSYQTLVCKYNLDTLFLHEVGLTNSIKED